MNAEELQNRLTAELDKIRNNIKRPNILLAGCTGAGKSSLINLCFGNELATVGVGEPVTQIINAYSHPDSSVVLFDSKGYEIGSEGERQFLEDVIGLAGNRAGAPENQIHLVWYCIQAPGARLTDFDIHAVKAMQEAGLPVAIVLTKSDLVSDKDAEELKIAIRSAIPGTAIYEVSTRTDLGRFEVDQLLAWSFGNLAESLRLGFVSAQRHSIDLKRKEAAKIIVQHTSGSSAVGFVPIPFSDAPVLIANQTAMLARILVVYDLHKALGEIPVMVVMAPVLREAGMFVAGNLLKIVPGIGTLAGGAINATVAGSLTYAFGMAVSELCVRIHEKALSGTLADASGLIANASSFLRESIAHELMKKR